MVVEHREDRCQEDMDKKVSGEEVMEVTVDKEVIGEVPMVQYATDV